MVAVPVSLCPQKDNHPPIYLCLGFNIFYFYSFIYLFILTMFSFHHSITIERFYVFVQNSKLLIYAPHHTNYYNKTNKTCWTLLENQGLTYNLICETNFFCTPTFYSGDAK